MSLKTKKTLGFIIAVSLLLCLSWPAVAAYRAHDNDADTNAFLAAYPSAQGTKLDNCYLCHTGGMVGSKTYDSCDYCHEIYGFKPPYKCDIRDTLNFFGKDYMDNGSDQAAFAAIAALDSDGDTYTNETEILAGRLPGDPKDYPGVEQAPAVVYTREQIRQMPTTTRFMAIDTAKAGDFYAAYTGVDIWTLLKKAGVNSDANSITVFAVDGYSKNFSIADIKLSYMQGKFFTRYPWIQWPLDVKLKDGHQLPGRASYLLAYAREGFPLQPSKIVAQDDGRWRLEGEGPYRFITPLKEPVVPDRSQYSIDRDNPPYPYNPNRPATRNGDFCIKAVVAIRVNTADNSSYQYEWNGLAWKYIQEGNIVVYGAINPQ